ncbi:MAG: hypothetical protein KKD75_01090 [Nanoarchaeota archaeon]|nr:hypothetical protein [Nanoarchaeota archaeon]MBU1875913.1 hypothetical protein [Nanoarchaeota archaeon]
MIISFFEEFPTDENLEKLRLITWPTKLHVAAKSPKEFEKIKKKVINDNRNDRNDKNKKNDKNQIKELIYWPILERKEGYWISPFSERKALLRIFNELKNKKISIMLDLELPTTKNSLLYITQSLNFLRNKRLIKRFIKYYQGKIYLAEYWPLGKIKKRILQLFGLHYNIKTRKINVIKMLYHSMLPFSDNLFRRELEEGKKEFGNNYLAGFGTIAKGIMGWEPILSPENLRNDLDIAKKAGVKEVVIFRLGGLNKEYVKFIKEVQ